jgi:hypothetical protein
MAITEKLFFMACQIEPFRSEVKQVYSVCWQANARKQAVFSALGVTRQCYIRQSKYSLTKHARWSFLHATKDEHDVHNHEEADQRPGPHDHLAALFRSHWRCGFEIGKLKDQRFLKNPRLPVNRGFFVE